MLATAGLGALVLAALGVEGHRGCSGQEVARRNPGGKVIHKRDDTTWQQEASLGPVEACTGYSYAPWTDLKPNYPTIWQTASILSSDTEAQNLFATINATVNQKVPNIQPRGTVTGDWTGVNLTGLNTPDVCWWTFGGCDTPTPSLGIQNDITTVPIPETWGFGFDDGPNCSHNALYDYLAEQNQKATMFYIGSNLADWPLQGIRGIKEGHQICVHTWSHQYMTSFSNDVAFAELYYTRKLIKDILGVTPKCWRPPFGDVDNRIRVIAEGLNLTNIVWSDDTADWKAGAANNAITPEQVDANYQSVLNAQANGTYKDHGPVVLNHELNNYTMSEMVKFYPMIKAQFQHILPIATALNISHPYEEEDVTYPSFDDYVNGRLNASNADTPSSLTPVSASSSASAGSAAGGSGSASASAAGSGSSGSSSSNNAAAAGKTSSAATPSIAHFVPGWTLGSMLIGLFIGGAVLF